jgi:hypothetical protein
MLPTVACPPFSTSPEPLSASCVFANNAFLSLDKTRPKLIVNGQDLLRSHEEDRDSECESVHAVTSRPPGALPPSCQDATGPQLEALPSNETDVL